VVIKTDRSDKTEIKKILLQKSAATSRGGLGLFQGLSSYLQLVIADFSGFVKG